MCIKSNKPPIVIFFFRREHVFEVVKQVKLYKPSKLYLVSDGGRNANEHIVCMDIRSKVEALIDWDCEIIKIYKGDNNGVDMIIPQTISKIFENEEKLIILEDDIVADRSFFTYSEELLERYKDEEKIMNICGTNWFDEQCFFTDKSYFYATSFETCGWATWKRAWQKYNHTMEGFFNSDIKQKLNVIYKNKFIERECYQLFSNHYAKVEEKDWKNSHWDGKYLYSCIMNGGLSIIPVKNLITNIGFDSSATHTTDSKSFLANKKRFFLDFPLKHNDIISANNDYDLLYAKKILNFSKINLLRRGVISVIRSIKKII